MAVWSEFTASCTVSAYTLETADNKHPKERNRAIPLTIERRENVI